MKIEVVSILLMMLMIGNVVVPIQSVQVNEDNNELNNNISVVEEKATIDKNDELPYSLNFVSGDLNQNKNKEKKIISDELAYDSKINDDENKVVQNYDTENFKMAKNNNDNMPDDPRFNEYKQLRQEYRNNKKENIAKFGTLSRTPITNNAQMSTLTPPWDDSGHGTQETNFLAFHTEDSSVNGNTGQGYIALAGSCGFAQWVISDAWCWCKGHFDCTQTDDYPVNFIIDYSGLATCVDFPLDLGWANLEMKATVSYQIAGESLETDLIFYRNVWPTTGSYEIPDPYSPPGPYTIGYSNWVTLNAGYTYEFAVQFDLHLDCAAFGFCVSAGSIYLNNWFLQADITSTTPPAEVDLVSQDMVEIGGDWYYCIWTDPLYFQPGDTVDLYATIWNDGADSANNYYLAIGLDGTLYPGGPYSLGPGGINNPATYYLPGFTWPNDLNTHYICCWADCYDNIEETNEDNNFGVIEWAAVGPPDIEVTDITLIKYNPGTWPPDPDNINWNNPDSFEVGDRVVPMTLISNDGDGPSFNLVIKYYEDNVLMAEGTVSLGTDAWIIMYISDGDTPGFIWNDPDCMDIRWEAHDYDYGQHDQKEENYCPEVNPVLNYNPTTINFGTHTQGDTDSDTFEIWNSGTGTLTYSLSESIDWITVNPTGGSSTGEHDTITVNVINTGSMSGFYEGDIQITSNGGSGTVHVEITIREPVPKVGVSGSINVKVEPGDYVERTFYVYNVGEDGSELDWKIVPNWPSWGSGWNCNPMRGDDLKPEDDRVEVTLSFYAPDTKAGFDGEIKVENRHDADDYATLHISCSTPKNKRSVNKVISNNNYEKAMNLQKITQLFRFINFQNDESSNVVYPTSLNSNKPKGVYLLLKN